MRSNRPINETHQTDLNIPTDDVHDHGWHDALREPRVFLKIVPPSLPIHQELVTISGVYEILLGTLLLIPRSSRLVA